MLALDARKFRIAKEAAELEVEAERLGGEARAAEALRAQLDAQGEAGAAVATAAEDEAVLKLKVYRSLGVAMLEPEEEVVARNGRAGAAGASASATRALVWSRRRGTAEVVPLAGTADGTQGNAVDLLWEAL